MKAHILLIIFVFAVLSCERDQNNEINEEDEFVPGDLAIGIKENASLRAAFNLVNDFQLEIEFVSGHYFISDLPNDSIDYVIKILKTKEYLNSERWQVVKDGNVYNHYSTGKITVLCSMVNMNKAHQTNWYTTASFLKLVEQPSIKVFYLKVPMGQEIFWRELFRSKYIVEWAELNYIVEINPWP